MKCNRRIIYHDVVGTEVYGTLEPYAFNMSELAKKLRTELLDEDAHKDLLSGEWLFGRGSCDMKGGIAVQLALLEDYSQNPEAGNLLFVSVPDEESFSAGMRGALWLFEEFEKDWDLEYKLLINCEPNEKIDHDKYIQLLESNNIPVFMLRIKSFEDVKAKLHLMSQIAGTEDKGDAVIAKLDKEVNGILNKLPKEKQTVVILHGRSLGFCTFLAVK